MFEKGNAACTTYSKRRSANLYRLRGINLACSYSYFSSFLPRLLRGTYAGERGSNVIGRNAREPAVLIVDDEPSVRRLLHVFLRMYVPEEMIITVTDGAEAFAYLSAHNVRLVITDNQMPRLTGLELTQIVKARYPETCVILLSGDLLQDIESCARAAGADYCLSKPFSVDGLRQILDGLFLRSLDERSVGRE